MFRALKPGGSILWYDFDCNNPWNPGVRGVSMSEIEKLFPAAEIHLEKITLAPPLTRLLVNFSWGFCLFLQNLGFLNTHWLGMIRKK